MKKNVILKQYKEIFKKQNLRKLIHKSHDVHELARNKIIFSDHLDMI